ncbi:dTDP-4-dehydrorhamnose 3,5-epimerase family protein [Maritimibacter dapengensis]|uniref:dTDP-4-dehydrorhamnose 3,5-epimerase family protein n=1 Tax=Maritimibacter dapengensis TaxID=2836868 RepID=A0ABS6T4Z9_9RHOB|nr:dTDP-4-dehydrorhamnose 3,5-epimerase family protein [Maritimibacter dapengensis]
MSSILDLPRTGLSVRPGKLSGSWIFEPKAIEDERGFFAETQRADMIEEVLGRPYRYAQTNHVHSKAGTLRGFRAEPWDKFLYVVRGTALIVLVDPRRDSPTFRQHETFLMGDAPGQRSRLIVERGLANAVYFYTDADYLNDVSAPYDGKMRNGFRWNDPSLGIDWPIGQPTISPSDAQLDDFDTFLETY